MPLKRRYGSTLFAVRQLDETYGKDLDYVEEHLPAPVPTTRPVDV